MRFGCGFRNGFCFGFDLSSIEKAIIVYEDGAVLSHGLCLMVGPLYLCVMFEREVEIDE